VGFGKSKNLGPNLNLWKREGSRLLVFALKTLLQQSYCLPEDIAPTDWKKGKASLVSEHYQFSWESGRIGIYAYAATSRTTNYNLPRTHLHYGAAKMFLQSN